ncbi:hypothetical protein [Stutzerimonas stutzeri]|uniref:hypothetical protein n=1 Tax=Stutzerimonas stutzeri TaxID=316 RepID=UPI001BCB570C|nr:hypothetical protein [Stutzerimonas stutzeri]
MFMAHQREARKETTNLDPAFALESGAIEQGVLPLVIALNEIPACSTIASCHGHRSRGFPFKRSAQKPYVLFRAPAVFAQKLTKWLEHGRGPSRDLAFVWAVTGYYYPPTCEELVWVIQAQDIRLDLGWDQVRIDADLQRLAVAIAQLRECNTYFEE